MKHSKKSGFLEICEKAVHSKNSAAHSESRPHIPSHINVQIPGHIHAHIPSHTIFHIPGHVNVRIQNHTKNQSKSDSNPGSSY